MARLRVSVNRLRKGMTIVEDIYSKTGAILVAEGSPVTKEVVNLLTRHFIDNVAVEYQTQADSVPAMQIENAPRVTEKEFREFQETFEVAENTLSDNLKDIVYNSKDINVQLLLNTMNSILEKANNEASLSDMLLMMKQNVSGLYTHAINVSLFGQILARWLNCTKQETESIAVSGLLHDIGILKFSDDALSGFTFRAEYETNKYEKHAIYGYNIIKDQNIDIDIKQAVLTHHERMDGSGFPMKVKQPNINKISRIIAIADTYDTLTMREENVETISVFSAIKKMEEFCYNNKMDSSFLITFTSHIAETMIRHHVLLSNGSTGQVVMINKYNLSRPLIQVGQTFVDLTKNPDLYVVALLD
jgi:putative nucleotidyltransferase with HDIG domain